MADADERQKHFDALRSKVAQLLRLPPDHPIVVRRAGDQLIYDGVLRNYIDDGRVDLRAYVQLSELNERNQPAPPIPDVNVEIQIVGRDGVPIDSLPPRVDLPPPG